MSREIFDLFECRMRALRECQTLDLIDKWVPVKSGVFWFCVDTTTWRSEFLHRLPEATKETVCAAIREFEEDHDA